MSLSETVIRNARMLRKMRGWSVGQFAEHARDSGAPEITANSIYNMESGRKTIVSVDELFAFADALGVTVQRLTEGPGCEACRDAPPAGFSCLTCGKETK